MWIHVGEKTSPSVSYNEKVALAIEKVFFDAIRPARVLQQPVGVTIKKSRVS
jgi:hypothetical protein